MTRCLAAPDRRQPARNRLRGLSETQPRAHRLGPTVLFAVFALASFGLLTLAWKQLGGCTAYAARTGVAGTVLVGMIWLGETASVIKVAALVLAGSVVLQLSGGALRSLTLAPEITREPPTRDQTFTQ